MTVVVENSTDQVEAYTKGNGVFPVPADVAADNAKQAAKAEKPEAAEPNKLVEHWKSIESKSAKEESKVEAKAEKPEENDDVEGEDGLTPRQKRDFTAAMQKTIAKKHRLQKEAEEFAATQYNQHKLAEQRASDLQAELDRVKSQLKPAEKVAELKEPARDAFKTDQEYWDAMVDYRVDKKLKVAQAEAAERAEMQRQEEAKAHAVAKIERARELVPDFNEVTAAVDKAVPPFVAGYMQDSDLFAEIGYHFAKHPEVLDRLSAFTDGIREGTPAFQKAVTRQLVELGKIESTLKPFSKEDNAVEASQTNGDKPSAQETGSSPSKPRAPIIRPVSGGSAAQVEKDEADLTGTQVISRWEKKHGVNLTARKRH